MEKQNDKPKLTKKEKKKKEQRRWVIFITIGTFLSTMLVTYISDVLLGDASLWVSLIILMVIILIGIISDIIGIAVATASIEHFNAMAARKIKGAKTCVTMVKNASKVSNVCNDVIGDICGIVSGATSVVIVAQLAEALSLTDTIMAGLLISGAVASITIGGKAFGKEFAMNNSTNIIHTIAKPLAGIKIFFNGKE